MEGITYLLKDGNIWQIPLTYSQETLNAELKDINYNCLALIPADQERSPKFNLSNHGIDIYQNYINDGYSIIRECPYCSFSDNKPGISDKYSQNIILNNQLTKQDITNIKMIINNLKHQPQHQIFNQSIKNLHPNDFDVFNEITLPIIEILGREKLGTLTKEEQQIIHNFRIFSLEELLLNHQLRHSIINNYNCGIIVINENQMMSKPCTKLSHNAEANQILRQMNDTRNLDVDLYKKAIIGRVIIQILYKEIIIWLPDLHLLTKFQKEALQQFINQLKELQQTHSQELKQEPLSIVAAEVNENNYQQLTDNNNHLQQLEELIDNRTKAR